MKNAVIYARYSSDKQNEISIQGQIEECRRYAEENDMIVLQEYVDRAQSAISDKRPNFLRMIDDSRDESFEIILVYQFDRFARNKNDSGYYKKILADNGVRVVSAKEQIASDSSGVITEGLLEVFADYFSKQLSEKVHRGMYQRAEQCKFNGGTMTFGYAVDDEGYYVVDENTGPVVKEIYERIASGETAKSIEEDLNARGILTVRGNRFSKNSLQNILRNEKYKGIYIFGNTRIPDGIPRIISDALFDDVQEVLSHQSRGHRPAVENYILTGKLYCGYCKKQMVGSSGTSGTGNTYRYYICKSPRNRCRKKNVPKDFIEALIIDACRKCLTDEVIDEVINTVTELNRRDRESPEIIRLKDEINSLENKIDKLINEIEEGLVLLRVAKRLSQREEELKYLQKCLKHEEAKQCTIHPWLVRDFMRKLRKRTYDTLYYQKMLVNIFVDKIFLYDDHFTLFLNNNKKHANTSKAEVETIEKYFTGVSSYTEECSVPKPPEFTRFWGFSFFGKSGINSLQTFIVLCPRCIVMQTRVESEKIFVSLHCLKFLVWSINHPHIIKIRNRKSFPDAFIRS